MSSFKNDVANEFRRAVNDPQNIVNGKPDWDFVESDVMIEFSVETVKENMGSLNAFFDYFEELVDLHLATQETL
jgi:hypothetical protein